MADVVADDLELPGQLHVPVPSPHSVTHFPGIPGTVQRACILVGVGKDSIFNFQQSDFEYGAILGPLLRWRFVLTLSDPSIVFLLVSASVAVLFFESSRVQ